jgi:c-di-GMP-binding flagellar brake protein YcgR
MPLLATMDYKLIGGGDQNTLLYFAIAIAVVTALILVGTLVSRRRRPMTAVEAQKYSSASFRRAGRTMGLPPQHVEALEELVRITKVKQPFLVFSSAGLLDDVLKKGLYSVEAARDLSPEAREQRKAILFQVKQIIEKNARRGAVLRSSVMLKPGQLLSVTPGGGGSFSTKVVSNMKDFLTVSAPAGPAGTEMRWMRGTPLAVYFWRDNDAGYTFPSKVLGYDTVKGLSCVLIQHSKTLRREQRRKARRREIMRACFYYPIRIAETGTGRKTERKASVETNLRTLGTVVDLSAGGCAIQTMSPFERGKLVMVEFDIDRKAPIRSFGKVMSVHRRKGRGGIMHVKFTSVTRQHLNRICSFVYDFSLAADSRQAPAARTVTVRPR